MGSLRAARLYRHQKHSSRSHRTLKQVKRAIQVLTGLEPSFRRLNVYPDDVFIVSYPRSGNTWVRFLIGNLVFPGRATFSNIDKLVPDIYNTDVKTLRSQDRPRYLKSHEPFDPRYPKVIYVVRDPRDVLVSYYYYKVRVRQIPDDYPMEKFARAFIEGTLDSFGSWEDHVASWVCTRRNSRRFLLLQYEDLLKDSLEGAKSIASFLDLNSSDELLQCSVSHSSFTQMSKLEREQQSVWKESRGLRKDIPFVPAGTTGQWKRPWPPGIISEMESS